MAETKEKQKQTRIKFFYSEAYDRTKIGEALQKLEEKINYWLDDMEVHKYKTIEIVDIGFTMQADNQSRFYAIIAMVRYAI